MRHDTPRHDPAETPVICIVYNRPLLTRGLISRLRQIKPRRVLIIADGPKPDNVIDHAACLQTRQETEQIDWDCCVDRDYAAVNLGCRARILSGLDWAFTHVDRAIILEDDIDAHPIFFNWATQMLNAYEGRRDVAMICGHNPLARWPVSSECHAGIASRRGGIYGWATWRDRWQSVPKDVADLTRPRTFGPELQELFAYYHEEALGRRLVSWDVLWSLRVALAGLVSIVSPINLIHNLGVGPDATLTHFGDDLHFRPARPALEASLKDPDHALYAELLPPNLALIPVDAANDAFDQARVLIELLVRTREPAVARRLAKHTALPFDRATRVHLLPFRQIEETRTCVEHIQRQGGDPTVVARWLRALGDSPQGRSTAGLR